MGAVVRRWRLPQTRLTITSAVTVLTMTVFMSYNVSSFTIPGIFASPKPSKLWTSKSVSLLQYVMPNSDSSNNLSDKTLSEPYKSFNNLENDETEYDESKNYITNIIGKTSDNKVPSGELEDARLIQELVALYCGSIPCDLVFSKEHLRKRSKRSSPGQNETFHDQGGLMGPFRVFKYVNDEIPGTSLGGAPEEIDEEIIKSNIKVDQNSTTIKVAESSSTRKHKKQKSKSSKKKNKKSKSDPILTRSRSVTDRSLIPNSYFASDQPTQNNQVALQNTFSSATTTATSIITLTTLPVADLTTTTSSPNLNGEIDHFKNSSFLAAFANNRTEGYDTSQAGVINNDSGNNNVAALPDDYLMEASSVSYQTYIPFNDSFLPDRSRRSPYKLNVPNPNPHFRNSGQLQFQIPQHHRLKPFPNNNHGYQQQNRPQGANQNSNPKNRAALFNNVRPGMNANRVGQPNNNRIIPQHQQPQFMQPPLQIRPPQVMRVQSGLPPHNANINKFPQPNNYQGPGRPQQVQMNKPQFPINPNVNNNNIKNNIKLQPPQLQVPPGVNLPGPGGIIKSQSNKDPVNPSSSNDHYIYRPYSDPNTEPTWNHPMYRRYSKAAKRFQNKVTDFFGSGSSEGKGSNRKKDFRTGDHSKLPPIPLPRPPRPLRRNKERPRQKQNGPIRYSYPKSAQNIQDILNHFQNDNNDIFDEMASKPGAHHHRPPKSAHSHHSHNHAEAPSYLYPPPQPSGAPAIASDLSNELKDVRFSLMRDIREFAKRPSLIPDQDDDHHHHHSPPSHSSMPSLPKYVPRIKPDDPINKFSHYYSPRDSPEEEENHSKHYPSTSTSQKRFSHKSPHNEDDIHPGGNSSLDPDGFDEMFYPKPKPVRDMIKASSKFKQQLDREEEDYHREREPSSNRKRNRPSRPSYRDPVIDSSKAAGDPPSSFYIRNKGSSGKNKYIDDPERSEEHQFGLKVPKRISSSRHPPPSSVEESPDQLPPMPTSTPSRQRDRSSQKYRESSDDSDSPTKNTHPNRIWTKPLDDSFHSWEEYKPTYYREKDNHERDNEDEPRRDNPKGFPKSIRDKIRSSSGEYNGHTRIRDESSTIRTSVNTPIVLKRPYEPYRIPPQIFDNDSQYNTMKNRGTDSEFWPTFTETEERIRSTNSKRPYSRNKHNNKPLVPSIGGLGAGPVLRPVSRYGYSPSGTPVLVPTGHNGLLSSPEVEEEVLEIHTGLTPPGSSSMSLQEKKLQQAYLDLLHHKMQQDAGMFGNNPSLIQQQMQQSKSQSSSSSSGHKKKAPMRMKIHIYPNNDNEHSSSDGMTGDNNNNGNPSWSATGNSWNIGGSSQSTMVSAPPSFNPRNPQQQFTHKMGGNRASIVPGPPYQAFTSPNAVGITSSPIGNSGGDKGNPNNPNKNLVLHLHVHRRNDIGPVELEAEASEHISSTIKPLTYKEIFDNHEEQQKNQLNNHQLEHHHQENNKDENKSGDKSVSMEVPIHDDKIEDVLHTLLHFRDNSDTPESQNRKKRKSSKSSSNKNKPKSHSDKSSSAKLSSSVEDQN